MKTLELNQMENLIAGEGNPQHCKMAMGMYGIIGGILGGPWGFAAGVALAGLTDDNCEGVW